MLGSEIVDYEMSKNAAESSKFFAFGFCLMLLFVFMTVVISSIIYDVLDFMKFFLALVTTICPVLAITSTFGILALVEMRTNTIMVSTRSLLYVFLR